MELVKVTIKNFLSIKEEQTIKINNTITSIIGLNESGKTTLLRAIEKLNGSKIEKREKNKNCKKEDSYIIGKFLISKNEVEKINDNYENSILKLPSADLYVKVMVDDKENARCYELYRKSDNNEEAIDMNCYIIDNLKKRFNSNGVTITKELMEILKTGEVEKAKDSLANLLEDHKEKPFYEELKSLVNELEKDDWIDLIPDFKIVKFSSSTDILKDEVDITEISSNIQVSNLFRIAGIDAKTIEQSVQNDDNEEITSCEENYKDHITKRFVEIFRQNDKDFSFRIRIDNKNNKLIFLTTDKTSGNNFIPLKNRSDGFKWYFSIYITLYEYLQRNDNKKYILLFDEPNLYLNPSAQNDLLERVFKKEFKNEQIIYTTHSPYMIDASNANSIRIVEKDEQTVFFNNTAEYIRNSKKNKKVNKNEVDPLTPILTALNLDISNKLILDREKKAVIVEGIEDLYILNAMIRKLELLEKFEFINFIPCFGASKVPTMFGYLYGMGYDTYVLVDNDVDGRAAIKEITGKEFKNNILFKNMMTYCIELNEDNNFVLENLFTASDKRKYLNPKNTVLYRDFYDKVEGLELDDKTIENFKELFDGILKHLNKI